MGNKGMEVLCEEFVSFLRVNKGYVIIFCNYHIGK